MRGKPNKKVSVTPPGSLIQSRLLFRKKFCWNLFWGLRAEAQVSVSDHSSLLLGPTGLQIDPGISVRKLLTDQRPMEDTKSTTKREAAASVSVASAKPKPTHHPFKFAFLFASLAKNSTVPSTGTPSPGHNWLQISAVQNLHLLDGRPSEKIWMLQRQEHWAGSRKPGTTKQTSNSRFPAHSSKDLRVA